MPKKNKKGKKKSTIIKPEIHIVEGESSFDVSDMERKKKETSLAHPISAVEAVEIEVDEVDDATNSHVNSFTISEVTQMRKFDSLAVIGKQGSINSNFSFFSDNNLTEREELETVESHHLVQRQTTFSSISSFATPKTIEESTSQGVIDLGEKLMIEELDLSDAEIENDVPNHHVKFEAEVGVNVINSSSSSDEDDIIIEHNHSEEARIKWTSEDSDRFTDQTGAIDDFLENLHEEIEKSNNNPVSEKPLEKTKSKLGWDNIFIKKEVKLEFKNSEEYISTDSELDVWRSKIQKGGIELLSQESLDYHFSSKDGSRFVDLNEGVGFLSTKTCNETCNVTYLEDIDEDFKKELNMNIYSDLYKVGGDFHKLLFFRHFVSVSSLTNQEKESLKVFAFNSAESILLDPVAVSDEIVVVETQGYDSFLLVSNLKLNLCSKIIPFIDSGTSILHVVIALSSLKTPRIAKINPVWMKCGYEEKIKMRHGVSYTVEVAGHSTKVQIDTKRCFFDEIQINNFSYDNDFLHLQIKELDKVVRSCTVLIFDKTRVDKEGAFYIVDMLKSKDLSTSTVDFGSFGSINNIEPFLASYRDGSVSKDEGSQLFNFLGIEEKLLETSNTELVIQNLGDKLKMLDFLEITTKSKLGHISDEIKSNLQLNFYD